MKRAVLIALAASALLAPPAMALETDELLALVAMPLAVSLVADIAEVPEDELFDLVALLNDADVPPAQFIEVVRYVPVALVVENDDPTFVDYVRMRLADGIDGETLVRLIEDRFRTYGIDDADLIVTEQRVAVADEAFIPEIVRTRVIERTDHPLGGPPGQVKKEIGVQTGAEVVHGEQPGKGKDRPVRTVVPDRDDNRGRGMGRPDDRGRGKDKDKPGKGKGQSNGKGKGN
ncbi:MAG: hypothetical protein ACRD2J_04545 [Thermoanaerobaculia bacterium]